MAISHLGFSHVGNIHTNSRLQQSFPAALGISPINHCFLWQKRKLAETAFQIPRAVIAHPSLFPYSQTLCNITSKILNRKSNQAGFQRGFEAAVLTVAKALHVPLKDTEKLTVKTTLSLFSLR